MTMSDRQGFGVLQKRIRLGWILAVFLVLSTVSAGVVVDWTFRSSVCDAQQEPEVEYAFTYPYLEGDEFYVLERSREGTVYKVDTAYSPGRSSLERDAGWRKLITSDGIRLWKGGFDLNIYPGEDYAEVRETGSNGTERMGIEDCGSALGVIRG